MKIVFISFYEAFPPVSGAASVSWNLAKHVKGEKTLIQISDRDGGIRTQDDVSIITLTGFVENRFKKVLRVTIWIFQIIGHINRIEPDIVVLEGASWVLYHWLLIKAIRLFAKHVKLIYHSHNVEYILRKEKHTRLITEITRWAEGRILHEVDTATAVSQVDCRQFEYLYGIKPQILLNGVDIDIFNQVSTTQIQTVKEKYALTNQTILFMGSYLYKPNQEGINFLINEVMPQLTRKYSDIKLVIIGGKVPAQESWLINPGTISAEKLPAFVKACKIGVAPIFSGSGTRLKILEYMAAGKPVVATAKASEGLDFCGEKNFLIADNAKGFASQIEKLLSDDKMSAALGLGGKKIVETCYAWDVIMNNYFNKMLKENGPYKTHN